MFAMLHTFYLIQMYDCFEIDPCRLATGISYDPVSSANITVNLKCVQCVVK